MEFVFRCFYNLEERIRKFEQKGEIVALGFPVEPNNIIAKVNAVLKIRNPNSQFNDGKPPTSYQSMMKTIFRWRVFFSFKTHTPSLVIHGNKQLDSSIVL